MMDGRAQLASMAAEELENGDFEMATKLLNQQVRLDPNNHENFFERAICHHRMGNYKESLEDVNEAIRLNAGDYNIHYLKGLALIGLSLFPEAVTSFKKAIELRAKQDDSKLSDIFKLLRDATNELNAARRRPGTVTANQTCSRPTPTPSTTNASNIPKVSPITGNQPDLVSHQKMNMTIVSNEPVDSTTDKPGPKLGFTFHHPSNTILPPGAKVVEGNHNGSVNLVTLTNRNSNQKQCANVHANMAKNNPIIVTPNTVTSSAGHFGNPTIQRSLDYNSNRSSHQLPMLDKSKALDHQHVVLANNQHNQPTQDSMLQPPLTASPFEWNIRRSERIFLHNSSEPGTSGHDDAASNHRFKTSSNPSSISSSKGQKRLHEQVSDTKSYQNDSASLTNSKHILGCNSFADSEVDVDDSGNNNLTANHLDLDANQPNHKRVIVTPSSSMPATDHSSATTNHKEDSYSSKYKRLRRDRERARRGTTKLCTIKRCDLDELQKLSKSNSDKRHMRVIAPIDGWLYSGQLSYDENDHQGGNEYVVKLDGDTTGSSYLFNQETVLNDVIKEVRVKSVSELRKGARICCYWSRQYKCLSTGVVTSRTFEATKSLVSVKYDNGDLSALPLEDLRLLPPDYPKYMSNCDPLLLARNADNVELNVATSKTVAGVVPAGNRFVAEINPSIYNSSATYSRAIRTGPGSFCEEHPDATDSKVESLQQDAQISSHNQIHKTDDESHHIMDNSDLKSAIDDETIPPTSETIDFITNESNLGIQEDNQLSEANSSRSVIATDNGDMLIAETQNSRASSEENNFGVEYRPWVFEGPPKRSKRNGRTYRDTYSAIRRGNEVLSVGDSAELMPRDESILPFIAKIDGLWATSRGEMKVRVRWYYRSIETEGQNFELQDGENALFETDHFDENDVQSIWRTAKILSWTNYCKDFMGHVNKPSDGPKIFYLAGYYDPVRRVRHLRSDVKGSR